MARSEVRRTRTLLWGGKGAVWLPGPFLLLSSSFTGPASWYHFSQLMTLTGKEFSEERELRLNELQSYLTDSTGGTLAALEDSYNRSPYPDPSSILHS
jgi:hypothetical protein